MAFADGRKQDLIYCQGCKDAKAAMSFSLPLLLLPCSPNLCSAQMCVLYTLYVYPTLVTHSKCLYYELPNAQKPWGW